MAPEPVTTGFASIVGAWVWDKYGKEISDKLLDEAKQRWDSFNWSKAAEQYQDRLRDLHSTIRVLGKSDPVPLEGIFTDVYILDEVSGRKRYDIEELRKHGEDRFEFRRQRQERHEGLKLIKQGGNLFILGKPGAGKTTFMRYITLQAATGQLDKVPIFLSLNEWSMKGGEELMPFIVQQFDICHFPEAQPFIEQLLSDGKAIVLFDGLDEVNQAGDRRRQLTFLLNDFAKKYRSSQVLITCRLAASEYQFDNFQDVELADFTRDQIHAYSHKWFADDETKQKAFIADLYEERNEGLQELCTVPLLLSMLCLAFEDTMRFPERRASLYDDAIDALLRKWDTSRSIRRDVFYRGLDRQQKQNLFAEIAAATFEDGDYFFEQRWLEDRITSHLKRLPGAQDSTATDGRAALKAIVAQHGILVERAKEIYAFSHLTFQEYFTAKYIVDSEDGAVKRLIHQHVAETRWREVFLLTASMLRDADRFFDEMRNAIDGLVADDEKLVELLTWAKEEAATSGTNLKPAAARALLVYIAIAIDSASDLNLTITIAIAIDLAVAIDSDITITSDLASASTITSDITITRDLASAITRTSDLASASASDLATDLATDSIHAITLASDQISSLRKYLEANRLLVACLKVANVSDRAAIEDSLLLPPKKGNR